MILLNILINIPIVTKVETVNALSTRRLIPATYHSSTRSDSWSAISERARKRKMIEITAKNPRINVIPVAIFSFFISVIFSVNLFIQNLAKCQIE
jgi:hypothetical protein